MGNRAVISTRESKNAIGIYVHWNGGPESVLAFLETCKQLGMRDPFADVTYGMARLTQTIANFFGVCDTSIGIGPNSTLDTDNGDNGFYILGPNWTIAKRLNTTDTCRTIDTLPPDQRARYADILAMCLAAAAKLRAE